MWPFGRTIELPSTLCGLMPNLQSSTSRIHNCNDSVTREVGKLQVPIRRSRDILQQAKGNIVESTLIRWFSRLSGRRGWSGKAIAKRRLRVSKLGSKRLSYCHSNETAVNAARLGASGPNKRSTLRKYLLKKAKLENSSKLD